MDFSWKNHGWKVEDISFNVIQSWLFICHQMDMRYSTIQQSDFTVNIRLVGIYIATVRIQRVYAFGGSGFLISLYLVLTVYLFLFIILATLSKFKLFWLTVESVAVNLELNRNQKKVIMCLSPWD